MAIYKICQHKEMTFNIDDEVWIKHCKEVGCGVEFKVEEK